METIQKKKAFGTFDHKPVFGESKRHQISEILLRIIEQKGLDVGLLAIASGLHRGSVVRVKNVTKPYTQNVFDKLLKGLEMTEAEFFKF
ncbi:MAG: hypothetical protein RLZZ312_1283 [Bacteroidota bacterium]